MGDVYRTLGLLVLVTVVLMVVPLFFIGTIIDLVLSTATLVMLVLIPALFLYNYHHPMFRDHVYSSWDLDLETVARSIDMSMRARGRNIAFHHKKGAVIFPLPPLNIAVARGRRRTHVYVGPLKAGNPSSVEGLKAFVEAALGRVG